ncbi:MAG: MBL fold metallo-hydrolase, partial [Clostridiales bacterium]|nr:MBL fold metallo-hydrolase [Clostridiales bacterium]
MKLEFFGAARTVTGSCHMLTWENGSLLVDCGMRQGADAKGLYGEDTFPFDPKDICAVLLTHAHIDHSGLLPLLVKRGFSGPILCTDATAQLSTIMLPDSASIQQQDADWQTRKNQRAGKPAVSPLYTLKDVDDTLRLYRGISYNETVALFPDVRVRMQNIGHLLGSAVIEIWVNEQGKTTKIVFSGDVGRADRPIIEDPAGIDTADYLVLEGTYGNRNHELASDAAKENELCNVLRGAIARSGNIVMPSFAVGRTQEILYY